MVKRIDALSEKREKETLQISIQAGDGNILRKQFLAVFQSLWPGDRILKRVVQITGHNRSGAAETVKIHDTAERSEWNIVINAGSPVLIKRKEFSDCEEKKPDNQEPDNQTDPSGRRDCNKCAVVQIPAFKEDKQGKRDEQLDPYQEPAEIIAFPDDRKKKQSQRTYSYGENQRFPAQNSLIPEQAEQVEQARKSICQADKKNSSVDS